MALHDPPGCGFFEVVHTGEVRLHSHGVGGGPPRLNQQSLSCRDEGCGGLMPRVSHTWRELDKPLNKLTMPTQSY
jgi:hypothetical protein